MLSTGIFGDSESGGNSKTVLCASARSAECFLQPSLIESGIDVNSPSVNEDEAALKLNITDEFGKKKEEMRYKSCAFSDDNLSLGSILSDCTTDCVKSVRSDFIVNNSENIIELQIKKSEAVLVQDRNFFKISSSLQSDNFSPTREKNGLVNLKNVEELIGIFVKPCETEKEVEREDPLFSLVDVYCPDENLETSLFPLSVSIPSPCVTDCSDNNICLSFMDYSEKNPISHTVCHGNSIPTHVSNEKKTMLDCNFCNSLTGDTTSAVSSYTTKVSIDQPEIDCDYGLMPELQHREHGNRTRRDGPSKKQKTLCIKQKMVSSESKVPSVSEMQKNSSCFVKLSKIEQEVVSACSLSQNTTEQVQMASLGNGYFSEFAKFVQSIAVSCPSALHACDSPRETTSYSLAHAAERQNSEIYVLERRSKRNCVNSNSNEDSQNCLMNLSVTRKQTSSRRSIQKPVCACCVKLDNHSSWVKVKNSGKRQTYRARQQGSMKDTEKSRQHLQYMIAVDAYRAQLEQLQCLQRKLFHLLHILFPFLASWKYIGPHSHALELLIDEITDSLKNSTHKRKAKAWRPCCPVVTLCSFPAQCLNSLKQKAAVLISHLIPSLQISDMELCQLEMVIDLLILSNDDGSNQF